MKCFTDNFIIANHLLVCLNYFLVSANLNVGEIEISSSIGNKNWEKLKEIKVDSKLMFDSNVKSLRKKASKKLNGPSRVAYQLDFNQRRLLLNAIMTSQFSYARDVWMFHSRKQNHHINPMHERALRVVYKDHDSSFDELFEKDNFCKIHDRNLQKLVTQFSRLK